MFSGSRRSWLLCATVLFAHSLLVAAPVDEAGGSRIVRTVILDGLTPVEKLFDVTLHGVQSVWYGYFNLLDTRRENERLQSEIAELRLEMNRNDEDVREARRLQRILDLDPSITAERLVARVIGQDTTPYRKTLTIDKGSAHGLRTNTPVITPDGIVGRIIHAGHYSAIVQIVSDPEGAVGAIAQSSRLQGIVRGDGTGYLKFEYVDDHVELLPGENILTSGTDQIYPKGLMVGTVAANVEDQDLMKIARLEPGADLGRLEEVICLVYDPGAADHLREVSDDGALTDSTTP